jgi:hypothetical protein
MSGVIRKHAVAVSEIVHYAAYEVLQKGLKCFRGNGASMRFRVRCIVTLALFSVAAPLVAACSSESPDIPGKVGGTNSASGGRDGGGALDGSAVIPPCPAGSDCPVGALCTSDAMCSSNICFVGGQTSFCTKKCDAAAADTDCPAPLYLGICNNRSYCKLR